MFKWLRKNEQGSVMVIVAIAMVALLGFTGLAVDFGALAMTKQELQNAADAAALAAGQDRMNGLSTTTATATANQYIAANGYNPGDGITISEVSFGTDTVTVTVSTQQKVAFSSILTGDQTETVSATAVAQITTAVGNFPYAMFAGNTIEENKSGIVVGGNDIYIYGNIHSNTSIDMSKAHIINGTATAVNSVNIASGEHANTLVIEMPRAEGPIAMVKNNCYWVNGSVVLKNNYSFEDFLDEAIEACPPTSEGINIYISGNLTHNGNGTTYHNSSYPINLVVGGTIDLNGCELTSSSSAPIMLISEGGDITVNGGGAGYTGLVFAPNGDVTLNGNDVNYSGSIIAQNIVKNGGKITVSYNDAVDDHLPNGKVRLIA